MQVFKDVVLVKKIQKEAEGFQVEERKDIDYFEVIQKGADCSDDYQVGDKVFTIAGQAYICDEMQLIRDEDILGKL